jgi:hypothetical protein
VHPTCDVATLADRVRRLGGERPRVAIEGEPYARTALLAECLRRLVPHLAVDDADPTVRVWMEDAGGLYAHMRDEQARGTWVPGTWVADLTPEQQEQVEARDAEERRRREQADLVFVGLDHFDSVIRLRFFAEHGCDFALWDDHGNAGEIEELLPVDDDLRTRIRTWAVAAEQGRPSGTREAGRALADELQQRLGPAYRIVHEP